MNLDNQEVNTILAALRTYQAAGYGEPCNRPLPIHAIATDDDNEISMNAEAIDELCEKINCSEDLQSDACPVCKAGDVEGGPVDIGEQSATQECNCLECGADWTAVYTLSENININEE
jgi:hypothetical protein